MTEVEMYESFLNGFRNAQVKEASEAPSIVDQIHAAREAEATAAEEIVEKEASVSPLADRFYSMLEVDLTKEAEDEGETEETSELPESVRTALGR